MNINVDGKYAQSAVNKLYRGAGMVSANNSSRLLLDYKAENSKVYKEILDLLFGADGVGINHLKIEMGSDINSSSGTEPCVKRTEDERADVTRGAGYQLAADAKKVNPTLTLDMLFWSEPLWVSKAEDVYAARYKWYKESLDGAFETYGLIFDYVSATRNERAAEPQWIKYLSQRLKSEKDCPYDYSQIKIVAGEEVGTWNIAAQMLSDRELLNAVDVVGSHYTSLADENAKRLADEYCKELWFSEGSSPMSYSKGVGRFDGNGSGLTDINGVLDVANRIITMVSGGGMTLYEYQPAVASYYDGVTYCQKQLILANEPWSGYYLLDGGFYMSLHFSNFIKKGWAFVGNACFADGIAGGDGHAVVNAKYSFLTATDTETGDYSTVITNTTDKAITYNFTVKNLKKASHPIIIFETRGSDGGEWNENYFKNIGRIIPTKCGEEFTFSVTVKPYSMVTLSTLDVKEKSYHKKESSLLTLPYRDDYEYTDYPENYLSSRGNAPRYTTDEGGAFEVQRVDGKNVLMQMITPEIKAFEWGYTPEPVTNFGDDRWFNYSVSTFVKFEKSSTPDKNYAGIGLRYILGDSGQSGWIFRLFENGYWELAKSKVCVSHGQAENLDSNLWINLRLKAVYNNVKGYINDKLVFFYECENSSPSAGRSALYSSYNRNCFNNFEATPIDGISPYITRFNDTDDCISYYGEWEHSTMSSFKNYKRTISKGGKGTAVVIDFCGTGFAVTGENDENGIINVKIDGEAVSENVCVGKTDFREIQYSKYGLENCNHRAEITVTNGVFTIDSVEVL